MGRVWIHAFANESLSACIRAAEVEADRYGDAYLIELDRETSCGQQPGQVPQWESSVVLLRVRMRGPIVVTLSVIPQEDVNSFRIECTSMGGNTLKAISFDADSSCGSLHKDLAEKLGVPDTCLKLVLPDGTILGSEHN